MTYLDDLEKALRIERELREWLAIHTRPQPPKISDRKAADRGPSPDNEPNSRNSESTHD